MKTREPGDVRFSHEKAQLIAKDLLSDAFHLPRNLRSEEYKQGFYAGAYNLLLERNLTHLCMSVPYTVGTCQADAWFSGLDEGKIAARSFQITCIAEEEPVLNKKVSCANQCEETSIETMASEAFVGF